MRPTAITVGEKEVNTMEQKTTITATKNAAKTEVINALAGILDLNQIGSGEFAVVASNGHPVKIAVSAADTVGTKATDKREARKPFVLSEAVADYEAEVAAKAKAAADKAAEKAAKAKS